MRKLFIVYLMLIFSGSYAQPTTIWKYNFNEKGANNSIFPNSVVDYEYKYDVNFGNIPDLQYPKVMYIYKGPFIKKGKVKFKANISYKANEIYDSIRIYASFPFAFAYVGYLNSGKWSGLASQTFEYTPDITGVSSKYLFKQFYTLSTSWIMRNGKLACKNCSTFTFSDSLVINIDTAYTSLKEEVLSVTNISPTSSDYNQEIRSTYPVDRNLPVFFSSYFCQNCEKSRFYFSLSPSQRDEFGRECSNSIKTGGFPQPRTFIGYSDINMSITTGEIYAEGFNGNQVTALDNEVLNEPSEEIIKIYDLTGKEILANNTKDQMVILLLKNGTRIKGFISEY